jgi:hypothetical protein
MSHFQRATLRPRRSRRRVAPPPLVVVNNDPNHDAYLLRVLSRTVGPDAFDATNISGNGYWGYKGELREALRFLDVKWDCRHYLKPRSQDRVDRWLKSVDGRDLGGLTLFRDRYGYCRIESSFCHSGAPTTAIEPRGGDTPEMSETPVIGPLDTPLWIGFDE